MKIFQSSLSYTTFEYIKKCRPDIKINLLRSYDNDNEETLKIIHGCLRTCKKYTGMMFPRMRDEISNVQFD